MEDARRRVIKIQILRNEKKFTVNLLILFHVLIIQAHTKKVYALYGHHQAKDSSHHSKTCFYTMFENGGGFVYELL